ncbi:MAG TPA: serine/threonine-protein kinase [Kofleriaceae bacterium]|jgi:serine/threonine protein kinase|nr:serine/threonine-protein kinase [Kofleriaceae bacterium]
MAVPELAVIDPSGRLIAGLRPLAAATRVSLHAISPDAPTEGYAAILVTLPLAGKLGPAPVAGPPRWIVVDAAHAERLAETAAQAGAAGVLLTPVSAAALEAITNLAPTPVELDLARARGLIATSLVDATGSAAQRLLAVAEGFEASDCIVWWRDGEPQAPATARPPPTERYREDIDDAARIAAAAAGTVITGGKTPRSVIAEVLRTSPTEVAGLVAIVADAARQFSAAERADLCQLALRLARERPWLSRPHPLVAAQDSTVTARDPGTFTGELSEGTIVGGTYRVIRELSRGAMGVVYRGEDLGLGRPVAIKVLRSDLASHHDLAARLRAEAGLLASLHHPNLVQVYALGEHAGDVYFVMELVEGQALSEVIRATLQRSEWVPTEAAAQITLEIGDALDAMHQVGVIHRDVKPANILLDREHDRAVLVDVGVAVRAGDPRDAAGTPGFAAPESLLDHSDAPTTDVYGLAATAYCMLTGRPPFGAGPASQVVQRQLGEPLLPPSQLRPSLSEAVDAVLAKALAPVAKKRWTSAGTFAIALARALERLPGDQATIARSSEDSISMAKELLGPTEGIDSVELRKAMRERAVTGHVRAAHLRVLSRVIEHHLGESGLAQIVGEAPALAGALSASLAPLGWAPLADLVTALELARTYVPSQSMPRKVGRGTINATFTRLFGSDPTTLSAEAVMTSLPQFWPHYHAWGDVSVRVQPGSADLVLHGYAGSVEVCALVVAELERVVEMTGADAVGVTHTSCALIDAPRCEYQVTWTR